VIAWVLLIEGAVWNDNVVRMTAPNCYYLKDGIFAGAGVLSLAATALGVTSCVLMRTKRVKAAAAPPLVVPPAEGEPKLPPAAIQGNNGSPRNEEVQRPLADKVTVPTPAIGIRASRTSRSADVAGRGRDGPTTAGPAASSSRRAK
jgi:hypothetical protein